MKHYEWIALPFILRSSADIRPVWPSVEQVQEYIANMKRSIETEKDIVKQRKKIIILEDYIKLQHKIRFQL